MVIRFVFYTIRKFKTEPPCDTTAHPTKMAKKKGQKTANVGEEMEPSHVAGGSANGTTTLENYFQYLLKKSGHPLY